jgi:hypothetical protein
MVRKAVTTLRRPHWSHKLGLWPKFLAGQSVCVSTEFTPYFYVKLGTRDPKKLFYKIKADCPSVVSYEVHKAKVLRVFCFGL